MKVFRFGLVVVAAAMITFGFGGTALAFHGGGVAHCDGCHSMHQQVDGASNILGTANANLTIGTDASSTCLNCHAGSGSYHVMSTDGSNYTPGGDFYWVNAGTWTVDHSDDATNMNRGHNIKAADFGLGDDSRFTQAPGGTYADANLGCTSCHDAHGQVLGGTTGAPISESGSYGAPDPLDGSILGNYRLLGDSQYEAGDSDSDGYGFSNDAPVATAANFFAGAYQEANGKHTDYGQGMSDWCANCHAGFLNPGNMHPVDVTLGGLGTNYNRYRATGDYDPAYTAADAYDFLVPFERATADQTTLLPTSTVGTDGSSKVMCLSCHRAHASPFKHMARWDLETELLAESNANAPAAVLTVQYGTRDIVADYGPYQRSLCNKCHHQD